MSHAVRVAALGDYKRSFPPHPATDEALAHAAAGLGLFLELEWIETGSILARIADLSLAHFDAYVIAPGSPYADLEGMLSGIWFARVSGKPVLGSCAGFQHMVLEFARNVAGIEDAVSLEYRPGEGTAVITPLACNVVGDVLPVSLRRGTSAWRLYGQSPVEERYYCQYGLAPEFVRTLQARGLMVTGTDPDGEPRVMELAEHPFYVATLFVPQARSTPERPHPLLTGLLEATL